MKMHTVEYNFFLKGGVVLDRTTQPDSPCGQHLSVINHFAKRFWLKKNYWKIITAFFFCVLVWLDPVCWDNVTELDKLPGFHGLVSSFEQFTRDWHSWYTLQDPENSALIGTSVLI